MISVLINLLLKYHLQERSKRVALRGLVLVFLSLFSFPMIYVITIRCCEENVGIHKREQPAGKFLSLDTALLFALSMWNCLVFQILVDVV
jgi:hypothetical protein